jgi:hypothetical protein
VPVIIASEVLRRLTLVSRIISYFGNFEGFQGWGKLPFLKFPRISKLLQVFLALAV